MAIATAAVLVRCATTSAGVQTPGFSLVIAASRLGLAALILVGQFSLEQCHSPQPTAPWPSRQALGYTIAAGIALALHFAAWITSLSYTSIAASTVLVTTTPIWVTIACRLIFHEKISRHTWGGIVTAIAGGLLIATDQTPGSSYSHALLGNGLALLGAFLVTGYILFGRAAQQAGLSTRGYSLLVYGIAAVLLFPLPFLVGSDYLGYPPITYLWLLLLAIVPQLIGHTSFNWAVRHISPSLVTLAVLAEPIGASLLGYFIFREIPTSRTLQGCGVILAGITIASLNKRKPSRTD